jgi:hypothetical protein
LEILIALNVKRFLKASIKLFLRLLLLHNVIMLCDFMKLGIVLNIVVFIILVNPLPLLASKTPNKRDRERLKQQEERQSEFVKGKSKFKY